jgi:pimeloyl-ACP methyl ester carboxylesterase
MGGDIANKVREVYPCRLISVVMGGVGQGVTKGWSSVSFDHEAFAKSLERGDGLKMFFNVPDGFGSQELPDVLKEVANDMFKKGQNEKALAAVVRAYEGLEVSEESLLENGVPSLFIVGENDPEHPTVLALQDVMKNARIVVIPDADHLQAGAHPDFISSAVEFMKSHSKRR